MMDLTNLQPTSDATRQFISFRVGGGEFAVDIMAVREIRRWSDTTPLPNAPEHVRGVINLRGVIVPIFDMRTRFRQGRTEPTRWHVIIIVAVDGKLVGILVDGVSDILEMDAQGIMPVPEVQTAPEDAYLDGVMTVDGRMIPVLGLSRLFAAEAEAFAAPEPVG